MTVDATQDNSAENMNPGLLEEAPGSAARRVLQEKFGIVLPDETDGGDVISASYTAIRKAAEEWTNKGAETYEAAEYASAADCFTLAMRTAQAALVFVERGSKEFDDTEAYILDVLLQRATCVYQMRRYDLMQEDINAAYEMERAMELNPHQLQKIKTLQNPGKKIPPKKQYPKEDIWKAMDVIFKAGEESEEEEEEQKKAEQKEVAKEAETKQDPKDEKKKTKGKKGKSKKKGTSAAVKPKAEEEEAPITTGNNEGKKKGTNWLFLIVMLVAQIVGMFMLIKRTNEGKIDLGWFGL